MLPPYLFNLYAEQMLRENELEKDECGIKIGVISIICVMLVTLFS